MLIAIAAVLLVLVGAGCSKEKSQVKDGAKKESKENKESKVLRTDVSEKQAIVAAAAKIDELRKVPNPDYSEIERIFNSELKELTEKRDAESQTTLTADIEKAIAAAKAGNEVTLNGQRISKTLIRAFYLSVAHEFAEAESTFADKTKEGAFHKWDEGEAYFGGLKSSGYFKENPQLLARIDEAFENGREAIAEDDLLGMKLEAQIIDKTVIRFFVGSVLLEAGEAKGLDAAKALEKIVEGQVFYSAVAAKFEAQNPQISAALGSVQTANPDTLRTLFAQGLTDKVIKESEEVISNWGTDKAAVVAREAVLYMETLKEVVGDKQVTDLGSVQDQVLQLESAVVANDKEEAESLVGKIAAALNTIKSSL